MTFLEKVREVEEGLKGDIGGVFGSGEEGLLRLIVERGFG